jgi:hypothetical protein
MDISVNVTNAGAANVAVSNGSTVSATVGNGGAVNVSLGTISPGNATVVSGTLTINSTQTLAAGSSAYAKNVGTAYAASLDIGIPAGPATLVSVGNTTTLASGSNATVTGTTSGSNLTLAFGIPRGVTPSFAIGNVVTGAAGSSASVTATTTNSGANVTLDLTIPRGDPGTSGSNGANGTSISLSDGTPANLGTASAGTSSLSARADHVHNLPVIAWANLSGVPSNFATNTTLVSGLSAGYAAINHSHNYVTSLNNLTGSLTLAAGSSNVTLTANGSTLTIDSKAGLDANAVIDGGDYVGQLAYGIKFGMQPQSVSTSSTTTVGLTSLSLDGTPPSSFAQVPGGLAGARSSVAFPYNNVTFAVYTSVDNGSTWTASSYENISSSGVYSPPLFSTSAATNGTRTILGSYKLMRSDTPTDASAWTTLYPWNQLTDGGYTVAFNGVRFVAVAKNTYNTQQPAGSRSLSVLSSSDGASWTARALPLPVNSSVVITSCWKTVAAVNGVFVIGGVARQASGGNNVFIPYIWTSSDGVTWTQSAFGSSVTNSDPYGIPTIDVFSDLASSGTLTIGVKGTTARYTTDGATWGTSTLPVSCDRISYAAGLFWAFSDVSGTDVLYSSNGVSWTLGTMPASALWREIAGSSVGFALSYGGGYARATIGSTYGSANLTVSATATGGSAVSYQWQSSVDAGTTWTNVANATNTTLSLVNITSANNGTRYRAAASATGATTVYSQSATLTVN